jgi:acetyl-CoA C-acetyltransferase
VGRVQRRPHGELRGACAREYGFGREEQDAYAVRSYRRAQAAIENGAAAAEIVAVDVPGRKGAVTTVDTDEGPAMVDFDKLPTLRPAFEPGGTVTAANASTINDGAAALVIDGRRHGDRSGLAGAGDGARVRLARPGAGAVPERPVGAMRALFERLGWSPDEVDAYEINEAFAVVPMAAMKEFGLTTDRVNVLGGAVAVGHPIGASGARILVTLLNVLQRVGGRRGIAGICIGGGEALALGVELA